MIAYHLLRDGTMYQDLGADFFQQRDREQVTKRAVNTLKRLGYEVSLEEAVAA